MSVYQRVYREGEQVISPPGGTFVVPPNCTATILPNGTIKLHQLPAIRAKINIEGRVKSIAADTPDELIHKLSRVLAKEGIDVWAILTKRPKKIPDKS